jgi:hypothetical protein
VCDHFDTCDTPQDRENPVARVVVSHAYNQEVEMGKSWLKANPGKKLVEIPTQSTNLV